MNLTDKQHKYSDVWSIDETNHWHECTECEAKSDVSKHTNTNKDHKCDICGEYFADKDGSKEIKQADTVTAKLTEKPTIFPSTGDAGNLALWIALLFIGGGAVTATTVYGRKKKRSVK